MKAFKDCMTVRELLHKLENYIKDDPSKLDNNVMIIDDWIPVKYFNVNTAIGSYFEREVKPQVIQKKKVKVKKEVMTFGNYHWEDNNGKNCNPGHCHIVSNGPIYEDVEEEQPCQIHPPEYKKEDVFLIVCDLSKEQK